MFIAVGLKSQRKLGPPLLPSRYSMGLHSHCRVLGRVFVMLCSTDWGAETELPETTVPFFFWQHSWHCRGL